MNHDECRRGVSRIAQHGFEAHDVALREIEVVTDADGRVNMYRQVQPSAFLNQISENVILKRAVLLFRRYSACDEPAIDVLSLRACWIAERHRSEIGYLELHGDA